MDPIKQDGTRLTALKYPSRDAQGRKVVEYCQDIFGHVNRACSYQKKYDVLYYIQTHKQQIAKRTAHVPYRYILQYMPIFYCLPPEIMQLVRVNMAHLVGT